MAREWPRWALDAANTAILVLTSASPSEADLDGTDMSGPSCVETGRDGYVRFTASLPKADRQLSAKYGPPARPAATSGLEGEAVAAASGARRSALRHEVNVR